MRFFPDDPTTVTVRWYFCSESAQNLPFPTVFNSTNWDSDKGQIRQLGEVGRKKWVDGSAPPWPHLAAPWGPPSQSIRSLFFTFTNIQNPFGTDYPVAGQVLELRRDDFSFFWTALVMKSLPAGYEVSLRYDPTFRELNTFGTYISRPFAGDRVPVLACNCCFPEASPVGTPDQFLVGVPFGSAGIGTDAHGYCPACGVGCGELLRDIVPFQPEPIFMTWQGFLQVGPGPPGHPPQNGCLTLDDLGPVSWICPPGVTLLRVTLVGAGGGGGNADVGVTGGGGGGGAGSWGITSLLPVVPGDTYEGFVGQGGAGGTGWDGDGNGLPGRDGGDTTWGELLVASGGKGGPGFPALGDETSGGLGGLILGEYRWHKDGHPGADGFQGAGGAGGSSHYAAGGAGGSTGGQAGGYPGAGGAGVRAAFPGGGRGGDGVIYLSWGVSDPSNPYVPPPLPGPANTTFPNGVFPNGVFPKGGFP